MDQTVPSNLKIKNIFEGTRLGLYTLVLIVSLVNYIFQNNFLNYSDQSKFYVFLLLGFTSHLFVISWTGEKKENENLTILGFCIDAIILNLLIGINSQFQTFFVFLNLVNIMVAGLRTQTRGVMIVTVLTAICFSVQILLGPELKNFQFSIVIIINNISFFTVAGLSGYLSEQLDVVGKKLVATGLALEDLQKLNGLVLENSPLSIVSFRENGSVLQNNYQFSKLTSLWKLHTSLTGETTNFWEIFNLDKELVVQKLEKSNQYRIEAPVQIFEEQRILQWSFSKTWSPFLKDTVYISMIDDLTHMRKVESALVQSEKMAAVGQLAAGIAHEIRNPLAGISGSIELLSQTTEQEDDKKLMRIILREIDRLNLLITEFLDYSKPETPPTETVNISSLIMDVVGSLKFNKNIRQDIPINYQIAANTLILGKAEKLKQAMLNILINAYQAMETVSDAELKISIEQNAEKVILRIRDKGCGMSEGTKKKMFEPFHTTKIKGTGLGLAITHKILQGHHADVFVDSAPGLGTEFNIQFPILNSNERL